MPLIPQLIRQQLQAAQSACAELGKVAAASGYNHKFTLDGRFVGDIGELIAAEVFAIDLYPRQRPCDDGICRVDEKTLKVQVKCRRKSTVIDLNWQSETPEPAKPAVQRLFVDEAGTPTLFHESGKVIVDTFGCSRFFILGKLEVENPATLADKLTNLRQQMLADPIFAGTESFKPERKKTAVAFHAKDDLPEVRFRVFDLLRQCGDQLRFYAVVCDKLKLHEVEAAKRVAQPGYRFNENSVYDSLMRELFGKFHRLADRYEVSVARRGNSTRNEAIKTALTYAERDFERKFGFRRNHPDDWSVTVLPSKAAPCLQAVDYFLWALQRFYEIKWNATKKQPQLDTNTGLVIREDRFLNAVWPQVGEIHDLHFGQAHGTFFTAKNQLKLEERFPPPPPKKKRP